MRGVNKVILIGNLGANPEVRYTAGGDPVANFNMATGDSKKEGNEWVELTDWHRVVAWGKLADVVQKYTHKGSRVYVEGKLKTRQWEDKGGNKRYTTEVVCQVLQLLDRKDDSGGGRGRSAEQGPHTERSRRAPAAEQPPVGGESDGDFDDDIPF